MKTDLNRILLLLVFVTIGMAFNSCDNYITPDLGKPRAGGVYLSQARLGTLKVELSNLNTEDTLDYSANIGGVGAADKDVIVHFSANTSLVNTYNAEHGTSYTVLPRENYELTSKTDTIPAGVKYGDSVQLFIKNYPNSLDTGKIYLLPITLKQVNGDLSINKNLQNAYFVITNSYYSKPAGSGTLTDPYQVVSLDNVQWISEHPSSWGSNFIQMENIDATDTRNWNDGKGFVPIGNEEPYFNGTYDGQGHTITGLYINLPKAEWVGLFCRTGENAILENMELENVDVTGLNDVGGVVGLHYGKIKDIKVSSGQVTGTNQGSTNDNIGGLVGSSHGDILGSSSGVDVNAKGNHIGGLAGYTDENTEVKDSYATGDVTGEGKEVGGLVGDNHGAVINCYATGIVHGTSGDYTGGLIGINYGPVENSYATGKVIGDGGGNGGLVGDTHGDISNCYATGDVVSAESNTGGLVGYQNDAIVKNCYATGDVQNKGDGFTGGLVGYANDDADIINSFSTGNVQTVSNYVGGLVGDSHSKIINCYSTGDASTGGAKYAGGLVGQFYDGIMKNCYSTGKVTNPGGTIGGLSGNKGGSSTITNSYWNMQSSGVSISYGGTALSTSDMQGENAKTKMLGFDFTSVWQTREGNYPVLQKNHL